MKIKPNIIPFLLLFFASFGVWEDLGKDTTGAMPIVCVLPVISCVLLYTAQAKKRVLLIQLSRILHWFYIMGLTYLMLVTRYFWMNIIRYPDIYPKPWSYFDSAAMALVCAVVVIFVQNKAARVLSDTSE